MSSAPVMRIVGLPDYTVEEERLLTSTKRLYWPEDKEEIILEVHRTYKLAPGIYRLIYREAKTYIVRQNGEKHIIPTPYPALKIVVAVVRGGKIVPFEKKDYWPTTQWDDAPTDPPKSMGE